MSATSLSRRRLINLKNESSLIQLSDLDEPILSLRVQRLFKRWGISIFMIAIVLFILCDFFAGLLTPFKVSIRGYPQAGRRKNIEIISDREEFIIPWKEWEERDLMNQTIHKEANSMINRHLFGKISPLELKSIDDLSQVARVMVFKLPRSGSTWFTELMNALPSVFLSKEIIQAEFDAGYSPEEKLRHLKRSLLWPTGKMSTGPWGGRFSSDYWSLGKWRQGQMDILGFTVNPIKVVTNYKRLIQQRPSAQVVAFVRSNTVKAVISAVRGGMTHELCGADNLRAEEAAKCQIPKVISIDAAQFERMVYERMVLERRFIELIYSLQRPVFEVTYENLQADPQRTINQLLQFLGKPGERVLRSVKTVSSDVQPTQKGGKTSLRPASGADGWVKRSSDDLRDHITNFGELLSVVRKVHSLCLERQLTSTQPGISFPPCSLPSFWISNPPS